MSIYAVNGKAPIAAWIPSRDTAGNGTTTLTDLVGSNNGTLTNMDPATDWVADTDAGGVRALDFDGSNDFVAIPSATITGYPYFISCWIRTANTSATVRAFFSIGSSVTSGDHIYLTLLANHRIHFNPRRAVVDAVVNTTATYNDNQWHHILAYSIAQNSHGLYVDGVLAGTSTASIGGFPSLNHSAIGCLRRVTNGFFFPGVVDDVSIFNQAPDATDVAYLYNSGTGRGRVAATAVSPRRRRDAMQMIGGGL